MNLRKLIRRTALLCAAAGSMAAPAAEKPLTVGLGDEFYCRSEGSKPEDIAALYRDLRGAGFDVTWGGCPAGWDEDVLENPTLLDYYREFARIIHENGMGAALGMNPKVLLPVGEAAAPWQACSLDIATGGRKTVRQWDFASPAAREELRKRFARFMEAMKPRELYFVDEVILIDPGPDAHEKRMSGYWTSPTWSAAALEDFRRFVAAGDYPALTGEIRFPVTTVAVEPSAKFNQGLPAVPITAENRDWLVADDHYPDSPLWQAWFDWRENLLTDLHAMQFELAERIFSDNPGWKGCMASSPTFWFCRESGLNADKIAAIPELDYLVAGYLNGRNLMQLAPAAAAHGKRLGGMIELAVYGNPDGVDPAAIEENFRTQVAKGAQLMLVYPLASFRRDRPASSSWHAVGMDYKPLQIAAWRNCLSGFSAGR